MRQRLRLIVLLTIASSTSACANPERARLENCFPGLAAGKISGVMGYAASMEGSAAAVFSAVCPKTALGVRFAASDKSPLDDYGSAVFRLDGLVESVDYGEKLVSLRPAPKLTLEPGLTTEDLNLKMQAGEVIK